LCCITYETEVELPSGLEVPIKCKARVTSIGNSGIGAYEYWGAKGYDKGVDYIEEYEVEDIESTDEDIILSPRGLEYVRSQLEEEEKHIDAIIEQLGEAYADWNNQEP
jgi:hypothetical protein